MRLEHYPVEKLKKEILAIYGNKTMIQFTQEQKKKIQDIGMAYDLRFIILHGSYAFGTPRHDSDTDIAFLGNHRPSFDALLAIHGALGEVFGDTQERELDVKELHGADPLFRYEVTRAGALLYGDQTAYDEFRAYAFRDYMESKDLRELEFALLKKSMNAIA